ncbi:MAG: glutathione S-transferase family protein [Alphaproteobacteria bacterium]|nr:glutathione S-transferase family protein [Alphaproteobacteria bacterium]
MIDFYGFNTSNGQKVAVMLEESGLPYTFKYLDMMTGAHLTDDYKKINPIGKMPAIVDHDGPGGKPLALFETLAISAYLAEKSGKLWPRDPVEKALALEWATVTPANLNAAFNVHFILKTRTKGDHAEVKDYYTSQVHRLMAVFDQRLGEAPYLAGETYSYADVQLYPVAVVSVAPLEGGLAPYPNVRAWIDRVGARPAVQKGMSVIAEGTPKS